MKELMELFAIFAKIGCFTFGGGYAMLPVIQDEVVAKRHWATDEEVLNYYAVGQCTPGIIAVNTATFIGYKQKGVLGAIFATLGMVFPSLVIITIISAFIQNFADLAVVRHAFNGIRAAVAVLVINAIIKMWPSSIKDAFGIVVFLITLTAGILFDFSPVYVVIVSAVLGIAANTIREKRGAAHD